MDCPQWLPNQNSKVLPEGIKRQLAKVLGVELTEYFEKPNIYLILICLIFFDKSTSIIDFGCI